MWKCQIGGGAWRNIDYAYMLDVYELAVEEGVIEEMEPWGEIYYEIYCRAEDEAHAMKKARDMLAKYKAEQEGIT